jgi:ABC-type enterochelin transport system permease subunit
MDQNPYEPPPQHVERASDWRVLVIALVMLGAVVGGLLMAGVVAFATAVITVMIGEAMGYQDAMRMTMTGFMIGGVLGLITLLAAVAIAARLLYKHYEQGHEGQ